MVPIRGAWTPFKDFNDQLSHYRAWGLVPEKAKKLRPIMVIDGYLGTPEPCEVVGYAGDNWAVISLPDGYHAIHGEYLAEMQPSAQQKLPRGLCFVEVLSHYVVCDIETTGFNRKTDRIIEIAAARYEYGKKIDSFHTFVNPQKLLPPNIVALTGIAQTDVDSAPTIDVVAPQFLDYIGQLPIIGHNALTFDVPFLSARLGTELENPKIDTLIMARKVFDLLPRHNLEYLKNVLHLCEIGSHRADWDVETTNALLWACLSPRLHESDVFHAFLDNRLNGSERKNSRKIKSQMAQQVDGKDQNEFRQSDSSEPLPV